MFLGAQLGPDAAGTGEDAEGRAAFGLPCEEVGGEAAVPAFMPKAW